MRTKHGTFFVLCLFLAFSSFHMAGADSLWEPEFKGYIADGSGVDIGTTLVVLINPAAELTLTAAHLDSSEGRLSFSGGEGSGLFEFLPQASSGTSIKVEEGSSYSLETRLNSLVTQRDQRGLYYLEGERSLTLNGYTENLKISGWFSPGQVSSDGTISFHSLHQSILEYSSPGLAAGQVISEEDLMKTEKPGTDRTEAASTEDVILDGSTLPAESPAVQADSASQPAAEEESELDFGYRLTEEKQIQILLRYFNRFLSTIFTQE